MSADSVERTLARTVELTGGVRMPQLGLGVFQVPSGGARGVVDAALSAGYRHIDTAAAYANEAGVGEAVRASGLRRDEVFITSKLRNGDQARAADAYAGTCDRLGVEVLDLYLIHWPNPAAGLWQDAWRALEDLLDAGRVRAIGVSNFLPEHLDELAGFARHLPAVNQIEVHPGFQQREAVAASTSLGAVVEAYSPLGQGSALESEIVVAIAAAHGVSPAQVVLRWHLQHGRVVIPKTTSPARMATNADLDGFALTPQEMAAVDELDSGARVGGDPRTFSLSQIR